MNNQKFSFWSLLNSYKIDIPKIQRDYAQGRSDKDDLRRKFLGQIKKALTTPKTTLKLDFIYGATEESNHLVLLDGQQRITTLWLIHWYIAFKTNKLEENKKTFSNFSYETRQTARDFINQLCEVNCSLNNELPLKSFIVRQNWFLHSFNYDPTVKGMLTMLSSGGDDCIESIFSDVDYDAIWKSLTGKEEYCPIQFFFKDMSDDKLPQTDDLYIKMNSRGRQLTGFENFKAEFFGCKFKYENGNERDFFDMNQKPDSEFISNFENDWTEVFWHFRHTKRFVIDDIFLKFINRFAINFYITENVKDGLSYTEAETEANNIRNLFSNLYPFRGIEQYKPILIDDFKEAFAATLNGICKAIKNEDGSNGFLKDKRFNLIPKYREEKDTDLSVEGVDYVDRPVFFAACKYFACLYNSSEKFNKRLYKDWIRFAWNLAHNSGAEGNLTKMIAVMRLINKYSCSCLHIIEYLASKEINAPENSNTLQRQIKEEMEKAKFIESLRVGNSATYGISEEIIYSSEQFSFFKGAISFLFHDGMGNVDWSNFITKLNTCKKYFSKDIPDGNKFINPLLLRNFVYRVKNFDSLYYVGFDSTSDSWRSILLDKQFYEPVDSVLMGKLLDDETLSKMPSSLGNSDPIKKRVHEDLYRTKLLEQTTWGAAFRLRPDGCPYRLMPYNSKAQWKKYNIGNIRNKLLSAAINNEKIELIEERRIGSSGFFWGDNIDFTYKGQIFRCYGKQRSDDNEIYLMIKEDDSLKYYQSPEGTYVMRNVKPEKVDVGEFCNELDILISETTRLSNK